MYVGIDFLIEKGKNLYLSEINTGVPAGAFEYDLVFREQFKKSSEVFERINNIAENNFSVSFKKHIRSLPYIDDLMKLKIWMDGKGLFPENPAKEIILEDKWVQYNIFSKEFEMLPTKVCSNSNDNFFKTYSSKNNKFVIKKRLGRGGNGFCIFQKGDRQKFISFPPEHYIIQPYIDSRIEGHSFSIRSLAFCGEFICFFASLSKNIVSNHGYRFYVEPGDKMDISKKDFTLKKINKKSWEADILYGDKIPGYLHEAVTIETISDSRLIIPHNIYGKIQKISARVSGRLMEIDFNRLGEYYLFNK
jgi:hypothetical protein